MFRTVAKLSTCGALLATRVCRSQIDDFSKILAQAHQQRSSTQGDPNYFDGNFQGSDRFINASNLSAMQSKFQESLTPEMRESMSNILNEIKLNNVDSLKNLFGGEDGPRMGVMAFGVGENEKGKKVARAAKYEYNAKGESVSKDFFEHQLEDDDVQLPKETVDDYSTDGAMEVEFVEDQKRFEKDR